MQTTSKLLITFNKVTHLFLTFTSFTNKSCFEKLHLKSFTKNTFQHVNCTTTKNGKAKEFPTVNHNQTQPIKFCNINRKIFPNLNTIRTLREFQIEREKLIFNETSLQQRDEDGCETFVFAVIRSFRKGEREIACQEKDYIRIFAMYKRCFVNYGCDTIAPHSNLQSNKNNSQFSSFK